MGMGVLHSLSVITRGSTYIGPAPASEITKRFHSANVCNPRCTEFKMMHYTVIATLCLLGMAAAQTQLELKSCVTKDQNLRIDCKFNSVSNPDPKSTCYFQTENKTVASFNNTIAPDNTYKNRGSIVFNRTLCQLTLTGFSDDKPKNFTCFIKQTAIPVQKLVTVKKSDLPTCSAWCVLQHNAVKFLIVFLTSPLLLELL